MQDTRRLPYLKKRINQSQNQPEFDGNNQINAPHTRNQQQATFREVEQPQYHEHPTAEAISHPQPPVQQVAQQSPLQQGQNQKKGSRIDTDQIPRPSVKSDESVTYQVFRTNSQPLYHPPSSNQYFITEEDCNAGPRYIRSSVYAIGNEPSITNQTEIPMGIIVQPLADPGAYEEGLPLVEFSNEPIRCHRCKAYMNPFVQFTDNGNQYICNICHFTNSVPNDYYSALGVGNLRGDKLERPELCKGCYEVVAPPEYIKKPLNNILLMFCIELTHQTVQMGVYLQILSSIQAILDSVPCPERTDIAIVTFDQRMIFYNIPQNLSSEPQIIIVSELDEVNIPLPQQKLFLNVQNDKEKISYLMEKLIKQADNVQQSKVHQGVPLGAMVNNAANLMAPRSGRILLFTHQFPTIGLGKLQPRRNDPKIFGTDNEKSLYIPQDQSYVNIAKFCLTNHISVDLWVFNENQHDLASIAPLSNITGGTLYFYPQYNPIVNGGELHYALFRNLTRNYAYDCVMTARLSSGLTLFDYCTGQGKVAVRDLEMATIDADKSIAIYFKHEDKIVDNEAYIQYALLYTNVFGQRLIKVINLQLQVVNKSGGNNPWHNIFKTSDLDAILGLHIRRHLATITQFSSKVIRQNIFNGLVNILHAYRKYCSATSPHGQLILPETIKTLPLLLLGLFKRDALRQGQVRVDSRIFDIHLLLTQTFVFIHNYLYPKVYPIHDMEEYLIKEQFYIGQLVEDQKVVMPTQIPTSIEKFRSDGITLSKQHYEGIYIVDTGLYIYILATRLASQQMLEDLFQVDHIDKLNQVECLANNDSDINQRVNNIIDQIRRQKNGAYHPVKIVVQNSQYYNYFLNWLVEDEMRQEKSYADFLCDIHAAIQAKGL